MSNNTKNTRLGRGLNSLLSAYSEAEADVRVEPKQPEKKSDISSKNNIENKKPAVKFHAQSAATPASMDNQATQVADAARIWKVAIDKLVANQYQPRQVFAEDKLKELADSIKEQGILQPIVARKTENNKYEIIAGERRWRAAQMAGLHDVPVILRNINDKRSLELAIIENVQRADLNPIEEAEAYYQLQTEFDLKQEEVAKKVGKDRATVANLLRLLQLQPEVREMLVRSEISQGHAKVLLSVEGELQQKKLAKLCVQKKLSVRQLEKEVKKLKNVTTGIVSPKSSAASLVESLAEDLQKKLGTKVQIDYSSGKGKISLYYYSDEQFTDITDKLKEAWV